MKQLFSCAYPLYIILLVGSTLPLQGTTIEQCSTQNKQENIPHQITTPAQLEQEIEPEVDTGVQEILAAFARMIGHAGMAFKYEGDPIMVGKSIASITQELFNLITIMAKQPSRYSDALFFEKELTVNKQTRCTTCKEERDIEKARIASLVLNGFASLANNLVQLAVRRDLRALQETVPQMIDTIAFIAEESQQKKSIPVTQKNVMQSLGLDITAQQKVHNIFLYEIKKAQLLGLSPQS